MDRVYKSGAAGGAPLAAENASAGYPTAGVPGVTPPTKPGPFWFHMITEELAQVILAAGIVLDKNSTTQLLSAIQALAISTERKLYGEIKNAKWLVEANTPAANQLRISLKTLAGADPSAGDPIKVAFRKASMTDGGFDEVNITAAVTPLVISVGSALGFGANETGHVYFGLLNNAGAAEIVACGKDAGLFTEDQIQNTTAEGGVGGADALGTLYSVAARNNVAVRLGGYARIQCGAVVGNWGNAATRIAQLAAPLGGDPRVAKIWAEYDDTGTAVLNKSHGVSSLTDNGTGDDTINFRIAMADTNYAALVNGTADRSIAQTQTYTTTSARIIWTRTVDLAAQNVSHAAIAIFGDQ